MPRLALATLAAFALAACRTPDRASGTTPVAPPPAPAPAQPPQPPREVLLADARTLRAEGDVAGARERLEAALAAAPADDEIRIELADLLVADGRELPRAEALLSEVPASGAPRLHLALARLAEAQGDDPRAAQEYGLALQEEDDHDVRFRLALALERLGRFDEATVELEKLRVGRPEDAVVRGRLADRYEAAGRSAEAEAELRALAAEGDRPADWERLARFYHRVGRPKEAAQAAERARATGGTPERALRPLLPSRR